MRLTARQTGIAAGLAGVAISAFTLGWWRSDPAGRGAIRANAPAAEWKLPQPKVLDLAADAKILLAKQAFGAPGERAAAGATRAAGQTAPAATQWRIGGIVTTETSHYLVVLLRQPGQNTDRAELRQVGENLPDGGIVRSVNPSSVTIDREGTLVTIRMFEKN